ncbi:hypothetical protein MMUR_30730 [Mycolicibacterium murale]|uniref:Uncharacterized protein n=1 Tax=Mycolicibacterium murale TaxID=182220 RepID=A0A7I9WNZ0_9MYCO|nr:hypothetical protein MMUR_30730 [Mycolicibacterium murale]
MRRFFVLPAFSGASFPAHMCAQRCPHRRVAEYTAQTSLQGWFVGRGPPATPTTPHLRPTNIYCGAELVFWRADGPLSAGQAAADDPLRGHFPCWVGRDAHKVATVGEKWGIVGYRGEGRREQQRKPSFPTGPRRGGDECFSVPTRPSSTTKGGSHCPPSSATHWQEG